MNVTRRPRLPPQPCPSIYPHICTLTSDAGIRIILYQHHQPKQQQQQQPPVPLSRALTACSSTEPVTISSGRQMRRLRIRGADSSGSPAADRHRPRVQETRATTYKAGQCASSRPALITRDSEPRPPGFAAVPARIAVHHALASPRPRRRAAAGRPGLLAAAAFRGSALSDTFDAHRVYNNGTEHIS